MAKQRFFLRLGLFSIVVALILWGSPQMGSETTRVYRHFTTRESPASHQERMDIAVRLQVLKNLLDERFPETYWTTGRAFNAPALDRLTACTLEGNCGPGESTVVILGSYHFGNSRAGHVSGEDIWAHSTMTAFEALNYTLLYAYGAMDALQIYQQIPDLVPIVILEGDALDGCVKRNHATALETDSNDSPGVWQAPTRIGCVKRPGFEEGIPVWKLFAFHFWPGSNSPLGGNWTLSPEDYGSWMPKDGNHYLGYSIEDKCRQIPFQEQREHRALILAKAPEMLAGDDFAWEGLLEGAAKSVPKSRDGKEFALVSTAGKSVQEGGPVNLPEPGVISMGAMPQMKWWSEVAKSKAMLGVGRPFLSPSPYDAMCFGVPFINVIFYRDEDDPQNKAKWWTMHDALLPLDPPYVYHVKQHEEAELRQALAAAASTPIGRFIPPWMTLEAVKDRHRELVERDWRALAEVVVAEQFPDGNSPFLL